MKVIGIILILIGLGVFIFQGIRTTEKEKVLDVGPVEISKQVQREPSWELYAAGGVAVVIGLVFVIANRNKKVSAT